MSIHSLAPSRLKDAAYAALLALAMFAVAALSFTHSDWDAGSQLHPDERSILFIAQTIELPASLQATFDARTSPLNPYRDAGGGQRSYAYGSLPLYGEVVAERALSLPCRLAPDACRSVPPDTFAGRLLNVAGASRFDHLTWVGRALSALADTLTILGAALLARRLFGHAAGLLAAWLTAFAVLHIQNAHFGTVDSALALFCTLAVWMLVRYTQTRTRRDSLLAGLLFGLTVGCKTSGLLLITPLLVAHLTARRGSRPPLPRFDLADHVTFWLSLLVASAAFALTNPYALLDPVPFLTNMATQARLVAGDLDWPFVRQYVGTLPLVYAITQQACWTLGLPLAAACYAGLAWASVRALRERCRALTVPAMWAVVVLLTAGCAFVKFPRYMLPATPTLIALAAGLICAPFWSGYPRSSEATQPQVAPRPNAAVRWALAGVILLPTAVYALAFARMYDAPHPWIAASTWIYDTIPAGAVIAVERWDDALPLNLAGTGQSNLRDETYTVTTLDPLAEPDDPAKLRTLLGQVAASDYVIISSSRLYGVVPRLRSRYPLTGGYYRALFDGTLGFRVVASFSRYPNLPGLSLVDDPFTHAGLANPLGGWPTGSIVAGFADESFTVYDHPLAMVFRNERRLTVAQMEAIITDEVR